MTFEAWFILVPSFTFVLNATRTSRAYKELPFTTHAITGQSVIIIQVASSSLRWYLGIGGCCMLPRDRALLSFFLAPSAGNSSYSLQCFALHPLTEFIMLFVLSQSFRVSHLSSFYVRGCGSPDVLMWHRGWLGITTCCVDMASRDPPRSSGQVYSTLRLEALVERRLVYLFICCHDFRRLQ